MVIDFVGNRYLQRTKNRNQNLWKKKQTQPAVKDFILYIYICTYIKYEMYEM